MRRLAWCLALAATIPFGGAAQSEDGPAPPGPKSPDESLACLVARPGFTVERVAAEPLVASPINLDWGADGRLWVVEMADYPSSAPNGRIRVLTDDDGDGRYDRSTTFLDGLTYPTAASAWRDGALVMNAGELIFASDRDGDGRAEHRETLWDGFHVGNPQHLATGFRRGLDGWFYGGNIQPGTVVRSRKGVTVDLGGHDFRFHPDRETIEPQSGVTQFLRTRDDWGNWFGNNNTNPMYHYVMEERYLRRNPHVSYPPVARDVPEQPGSAPVFPISRTLPRFNDFHTANRFTSACSAIVYRDELLGGEFVGNSFVSEPVHNLVHREIVRREGATFRSRRAVDETDREFLASTDSWFRPTTIETGPDGALWVVDMYRQIIEHPEWIPPDRLAQLDVNAGVDMGRIYRVFPQGQRPRPIEPLDKLSNAALVAALDHPNGWRRDMAGQLLRERAAKDAVPALRRQAREARYAVARVHALYLLADLEGGLDTSTLAAMTSDDPRIRRHAVALLPRAASPGADWPDAFRKLAADGDAQVRLEVAYALGEFPSAANARTLVDLAAQEKDEYVYAAALSSLANMGDEAAQAVDSAWSPEIPGPRFLGDLLATADGRLGQLQAKLPPAASQGGIASPWTRVFQRAFSPPFDERQFDGLARFSDILQSRGFSAVSGRRPWRLAPPELIEQSERTLYDASHPTAARLRAMALLALDPRQRASAEWSDRYRRLLGPAVPRELQRAAVDALARLGTDEAGAALLAEWPTYDATLREAVLDALLARRAWQTEVVEAMELDPEARFLEPSHFTASQRQRLLSIEDAEHRAAAERFFATASSNRREVVERYLRECPSEGDAARGEAVFRERCASCHRLYDQGHAVGPELTALVDRSREVLLEAILDPNRAVESRFVAYVAVTDQGLTYTGVWRGETAGVVMLVGPEGRQHELPRSRLETLEANGRSLMPEGLEIDISPAQMADLLAYFRARRSPPKQIAGNTPATVAPDPLRREFFCLPENAAIHGPSLTIESADRNLGAWRSEQDYAAWTLDVPQTARYMVLLEWSCDAADAGNTAVIESGRERITYEVPATAGPSHYDRAKIGEIELEAGRRAVTLRGLGGIRGSLLRFRSLTLRPID